MSEYFDTVRTRFAPSPTGFMHVGNLRTALFAWLLARANNGKFILRIEDTDQQRYVEGAVDVIYQTLAAAGLTYDEGPDKDGGFGPYVQSERKSLYLPCAQQLVKLGKAYYCFCDKNEEEKSPDEADYTDTAVNDPCRDIDPAEAEKMVAAGKPFVIRQKIDREGSTTFTDCVFGEITIENKVLDDQILIKRDGMPTYNFANVIDDHLMKISHVVRGCEYLSSTPKYNLLYRSFGWEIPQYVHLPLIMGKDAEGNVTKLSKRHGSVSFENLVQEGYLPEAIVNYIALLGWNPKDGREILPLDELRTIFGVHGLNKTSAVFDYEKLAWMNGEYIKALPDEELAKRSLAFSGLAGTRFEAVYTKIAALLRQRILKLSEIPEKIAFLLDRPAYDRDMFFNKKSKCSAEAALPVIQECLPLLEGVAEWNNDSLFALFSTYAEQKGVKINQVMWAVRVGATAQAVTPGGATELLEILGKDETLKRLHEAVEFLAQ